MMAGYDYNWFGMSMMMLGMVVSIALMVVIIWAAVRWLNNKKTLTMPSMRQPQDSYQKYEQGYEPHQPPISTFQGAEMQSQYQQPEYDQPQAQYPQEMPLQQ